MFGLPEDEDRTGARRPEVSGERRSSPRAGSRSPATSPSSPPAGCRRGFRAAGVACGIKPSGDLDLGLLVSDAPGDDQRRALHPLGHAVGAGAAVPRALHARGIRGGGRQLRQRQRRDRAPRTRERGQDAGRRGARLRGSATESAVAVASTGVIGVPLPMDAVMQRHRRRRPRAAPRRRGRLRGARSGPPTRSPSTPCLEVGARGGHGPADRPGQGRGDDLARASRRCCASCRPTPRCRPRRCDLLLGVTVKRSFERISVDGQLSTSDTVILQCSGESGRAGRARDRGRAALRRGARRADAPARADDRRATARGRGASGAWSCAAATSGRSTRVAHAVADSPLVKTALYGGDPNWGRIVQAVGHGDARHGAAARSTSRSRASQVCARGAYVPHDADALTRRRAARRGRVRDRAARRGRRDRAVLLRPGPRVRDDQCGVHDLRRPTTSADARHRHPARGAALHPRVPRQDGGDQVRRRGDDRRRRSRRSSRATWCCSSTSG